MESNNRNDYFLTQHSNIENHDCKYIREENSILYGCDD